jgi:hypothetical protein
MCISTINAVFTENATIVCVTVVIATITAVCVLVATGGVMLPRRHTMDKLYGNVFTVDQLGIL